MVLIFLSFVVFKQIFPEQKVDTTVIVVRTFTTISVSNALYQEVCLPLKL